MRNLVRYLPATARILLGLVFTVFGLNGFLHFLPTPPMSGPSRDFAMALGATGYIFPILKAFEVASGLMLLSGRLVPLALTLLAPVIVNIVAFHLVLTPPNPVAFVVLALELYLAWSHRSAFRALLAARAQPASSAANEPPTVPARATA